MCESAITTAIKLATTILPDLCKICNFIADYSSYYSHACNTKRTIRLLKSLLQLPYCCHKHATFATLRPPCLDCLQAAKNSITTSRKRTGCYKTACLCKCIVANQRRALSTYGQKNMSRKNNYCKNIRTKAFKGRQIDLRIANCTRSLVL